MEQQMLDELSNAYFNAQSEYNAPVSWTSFKREYGEGASRDIINAIDAGYIDVEQVCHGIRASGSWPRYNKGKLLLKFNY